MVTIGGGLLGRSGSLDAQMRPDDGAVADLDQVYDDHFAFVWRSARRLGVPADGLDDVVQDVFLVAHRRWKDFEGRSSVKTWLFGIVLRVARDHRRRGARRGIAEPLPEELEDRTTPSAHEQVEQGEALRTLELLLDALDEDKRAVIVLAELEGMTAPEIAAALEVKVNTVYSRLRAARLALDAAAKRLRAQAEEAPMSALGREAQEIIDAARGQGEPTAADRARVRAKLRARLAEQGGRPEAAKDAGAAKDAADAGVTGGATGGAGVVVGAAGLVLVVLALVGAVVSQGTPNAVSEDSRTEASASASGGASGGGPLGAPGPVPAGLRDGEGAAAAGGEAASWARGEASVARGASASGARGASASGVRGESASGARGESASGARGESASGARGESASVVRGAVHAPGLASEPPSRTGARGRGASGAATLPEVASAGSEHLELAAPGLAGGVRSSTGAARFAEVRAADAGLEAELLLLRLAREALRDHAPARALVRVEEHAERFPTGMLREEREATRIVAWCTIGRFAEARAARARFAAEFPGSPHGPRIEATCAADREAR